MGSETQLTIDKPSKQVTQVNQVLESTLSSLAGLIKTNKRSGFSWFCWTHCQSNKILRAGFTGFYTQLTQVTCFVRPILPSFAGFVKVMKSHVLTGFDLLVATATKSIELGSLVLEPSIPSLAGFIKKKNKKLGFSQKTR